MDKVLVGKVKGACRDIIVEGVQGLIADRGLDPEDVVINYVQGGCGEHAEVFKVSAQAKETKDHALAPVAN